MRENHHSFPPSPFTAVTAAAMDAMNGGEDHFNCLPDAIITEIFSKVSHAKYLIRCFAVCKRFASLLPQTHTVFIPVHSPWTNHHYPTSSARNQNLANTDSAVRLFHRRSLPAPSPPSSICPAPPRALSDLKKFTGIQSLSIELHPPPGYRVTTSWIAYKAVIGARLEILVAIFAAALRDKMEEGEGLNGATLASIDFEEVIALKIIKRCLNNAFNYHGFAQTMIYDLPALSELVIGGKLVGNLYMGENQIAELRKNRGISGVESELSASEVIGGNGVVGVKKWHAAALELPLSDRVMDRVTVAVVRPEGEEIVFGRDVDLILGGFAAGDEEDDDGKDIEEIVNVVREKIRNVQDEIKASVLDL